jgi:hypothetical protein
MPTYNFRNTETGEEFEVMLRMSELDEYKEKNPHLIQFLTSGPSIVSGGGNFNSKVPQWHKDNMKEMKKLHPKGNYGVID